MNDKRLNIALIVPYVDNEYSSLVINGSMRAAARLDVNLFILPVRYLKAKYLDPNANKYSYQFTTLLKYVNNASIDGVVIEAASIGCFVTPEEIEAEIRSFGNIPVITLSQQIGTFPCLKFNCEGLKKEIEHLITVHKKRRIAFVGGPMSNADSVARYNAFREVIDKYGLEFNDNLFVEGDFSEFCTDAVKRVLDNNPDGIDAICFANDRMAIGGYKTVKERGMAIGTDIAIVGFDDAPSAAASAPKMTTVHSDVPLLGYRAVEECYELIKHGRVGDLVLDTTAVIRESCGCSSGSGYIHKFIEDMNAVDSMPWNELRDNIFKLLNFDYSEMDDFGTSCLMRVYDDIIKAAEYGGDFGGIMRDFRRALGKLDFSFVSFEEFAFSVIVVQNKANAISHKNMTISGVRKLFSDIERFLITDGHKSTYIYRSAIRERAIFTSGIINNVLSKIERGDESYHVICVNLDKIGISHSCLFINEGVLYNDNDDKWQRPDTERLVCIYKDKKLHIVDEAERIVPSDDIFKLSTDNNERCTMIALPLYYNNEHYGVIVCQAKEDVLQYLTCVAHDQINFALKMKYLIEEQAAVHSQLRKSMEQIRNNNVILSNISKSDELTGILNRRGFMQAASQQLSLPSNQGRSVVVVFVDMNDLKKVNDSFGHEDGDFSLKAIASILKRCFRSTDIIARIGGDEFAAFALVDIPDIAVIIHSRLKKYSDELNLLSGKPYNITMSAGIEQFTCGDNVSLSELMTAADNKLYIDKKNKPKNFLKE